MDCKAWEFETVVVFRRALQYYFLLLLNEISEVLLVSCWQQTVRGDFKLVDLHDDKQFVKFLAPVHQF